MVEAIPQHELPDLDGRTSEARPESQQQMLEMEDEDRVPTNLQEYIERHNFDNVVNQVVNKVIKERPADPVQTIAQMLLLQAKKSYPTFDKLVARRVFIQDNPALQTVKIGVYLTF